MLFDIIGAGRKQALFIINKYNNLFKKNNLVLFPNKTMNHGNPLVYHQYSENCRICIVNYLKILHRYLKDTGKTRNEITLNCLWNNAETGNMRQSLLMYT